MNLIKDAIELALPKPLALLFEKVTEKKAPEAAGSGHGLLMSGAEGAAAGALDKFLGGSLAEAGIVGAAETDLAHGRKGLIGLAEEGTVAYKIGMRIGEKFAGKGWLSEAFGAAATAAIFLFEPKVLGAAEPAPQLA